MAPLEDFKLSDFDSILAINVRAVFVATQAAARHMKEGGRIINIGSTNAEAHAIRRGRRLRDEQVGAARPRPGPLARPRPRGITINNVQPGPVDTETQSRHRRIRRNPSRN